MTVTEAKYQFSFIFFKGVGRDGIKKKCVQKKKVSSAYFRSRLITVRRHHCWALMSWDVTAADMAEQTPAVLLVSRGSWSRMLSSEENGMHPIPALLNSVSGKESYSTGNTTDGNGRQVQYLFSACHQPSWAASGLPSQRHFRGKDSHWICKVLGRCHCR